MGGGRDRAKRSRKETPVCFRLAWTGPRRPEEGEGRPAGASEALISLLCFPFFSFLLITACGDPGGPSGVLAATVVERGHSLPLTSLLYG